MRASLPYLERPRALPGPESGPGAEFLAPGACSPIHETRLWHSSGTEDGPRGVIKNQPGRPGHTKTSIKQWVWPARWYRAGAFSIAHLTQVKRDTYRNIKIEES